MDAYRSSLTRFVYQTGMLMRPVFNAAKSLPKAQNALPTPMARTSALRRRPVRH